MANIRASADHSRTTLDPGFTAAASQAESEWTDLEETPVDGETWYTVSQHYSDQQVRRHQYAPPRVKNLTDDELLAMLRLGLDAFALPQQIPPPPHGLPGAPHVAIDYFDDPAMEILSLGSDYLAAIIQGNPRVMANRFQAARQLCQKLREQGRQAAIEASARKHDWRDLEDEQQVYFIGSDLGSIKIGMAKVPEARLKTLQTSHPAKLKLLAVCPGGREQERVYHERFVEFREAGEWFSPAPEILAEIARLSPSPLQEQTA